MPSQRQPDEVKKPVTNGLGEEAVPEIVSSIPEVPVTVQHKPFLQPNGRITVPHAGTARANLAPSTESPRGTLQNGWAEKHTHQTVLQQHCEFFDSDKDGVIWPQDTFAGFYKLGYGVILSIVAVVIIHPNFFYATQKSWIPNPRLLIHLDNVHKDKHGSDTGTYDTEGRFVPQNFENIFAKYADGKDYLTTWDIVKIWNGQRLLMDPIGWGAAIFEWLATYLLLWPADGRMQKEDVRGVYDGSIFYTIAARRAMNQPVGALEESPQKVHSA